jgi:TDG/mug DNA glycosylase family protein
MDILPDLLRPGLKLVICGSAAGLRSAEAGAYYAGPGNRFWEILFKTGLTPTRLSPAEFPRLLDFQIGLTDMAKKTFGADSGLAAGDFDALRVRDLIVAHRPMILAFNGKRAASAFFGRTVDYGYRETFGTTRIYVAPSTSGAARGFWNEDIWREIGDSVRAVNSVPWRGHSHA